MSPSVIDDPAAPPLPGSLSSHAVASILAFLLTCGISGAAPAAGDDALRAAYVRAEALLPSNVPRQLHGLQIQPRWLEGSDRFWYRETSAAGSEFVLIDAAHATRVPAFDHDRLAAALSHLSGESRSGRDLPFQSFEFHSGTRRLRTEVAGTPVECDLESYACRKLEPAGLALPGEVASPNGRWAAFVRDHDLYVRALEDGRETRLTHDGTAGYGYGEWADSNLLSVTALLRGNVRPARVLWSPDSRRLLSYRVDQRGIPEMPFVQWVPEEGYGSRPKVHTARVPFPGDERTATAKLILFELPSGRRTDVPVEPVPLYYDLIGWGQIWWQPDGRRVFHMREERGFRRVGLNVTEAATGATRTLLEESVPTYFLAEYDQLATCMTASRLHWLSARDGWQHLYRYDLETGRLLSQVTHGDWAVDRLVHADPGEGWVYFTAGGRESGRDPYYLHLYRARYDGSATQLLTPEDAYHQIDFSPSGRFFVDTHSRVDLPPVSVLRRADGRLVRVLQKADIGALQARGMQKVERFKAKARDGATDIYGTIFLPSGFDPARRYPVLDDIYGGPQTVKAERTFSAGSPIAELGFINVQIDGMGTPGRSKAFQDVSYGKGFAEAGGLEDHITALKQLAARRPYMDLDRVGIYGHSGGGYSSTRALLDHPDFYKVAVSSAGSHDQMLYQLEWGERFIGLPSQDPQAYELQSNSRHVSRSKLSGKLLLASGDLDDDVPIANTMQLAHALIQANADFELLIVPGTNHSTLASHPYFIRKRWDFFVQHLLGAQPPAGYRIGGTPDGRPD